MDSRSIDFAKTASINIMDLNNKIVNMRQLVKKAKVQVINKLCRQIGSLKKKKGTEEQKRKNLNKAERMIEEIDSIKKLKADKISKYALGNTVAFKDVSKVSLLPGPRALARLSEHPVVMKVVKEFRQQHSDWRDLSAYLLMKQTGRRFKTKKQKQLKLSRCVENINASETMTKAYIQEKFGEEELMKAEQKFESKRKRQKPGTQKECPDIHTVAQTSVDELKVCPETEVQLEAKERKHLEKLKDDSVIEKREKNKLSMKELSVLKCETEDVPNVPDEDDSNEEMSNLVGEDSDDDQTVLTEKQQTHGFEAEDKSDFDHDLATTSNCKALLKRTSCVPGIQMEKSEKVKRVKRKVKRDECVVKELKLEKQDSDVDDSSDTDSHSKESDNSDKEGSQSSDSEHESSNESQEGAMRTHGQVVDNIIPEHRGKKKSTVPDFLVTTKNVAEKFKDPFFALSDDDYDGDNASLASESDEFTDVNEHNDEDFSGSVSKKQKLYSMFYNPESEGENISRMRNSRGTRTGRGGQGRDRRKFASTRSADVSLNSRGSRGGWKERGRWSGRERGQWARGKEGRNFRGRHMKPRGQSTFQHEVETRDGRHTREIDTGRSTLKNAATEEKLHPSWEASRKRKAEQGGLVAFQGSKVTFDDD